MDTAMQPVVSLPPLIVRAPDRRADRASDPAQEFVTRIRAAAPEFATAAGAQTAVVREVVPPARHRVARCRVALRFAGDAEVDLTFLGTTSRGITTGGDLFDLQIQDWLVSDRASEEAWLVSDDESPDGLAVDIPAWVATTRSVAS